MAPNTFESINLYFLWICKYMRDVFTVIDTNYKKVPKVPDREYIFYYIIWFLVKNRYSIPSSDLIRKHWAHAKSRIRARCPQHQCCDCWSHPAAQIWSDSNVGTWLSFSCVSQTLQSCILVCWLCVKGWGRQKMHRADSTKISGQGSTSRSARCRL